MLLKVGDRYIGKDQPCFVIAEIGNNHNGSIAIAKQLVDEAVNAGVDAVKFQMRDMTALYGKLDSGAKASADLGTQYTLDLLEKFQLTNEELLEVFDYCRSRGILAFCTPWDLNSLNVLESYGMELYKVASADLTNHPLLKKMGATGKPLICSTGMSTELEIESSIEILKAHAKGGFALLHCNSTYPAPFKDINLRYLVKLASLCEIVGYSGHERGIHIPIGAVAMGASIIEKHFTLDKKMEGVDHKVSLLPSEMALMVQQIRELELAFGNADLPRKLSQGEMMNRENLGKSIVALDFVRKGEVFTESMLTVRSPGQGLPAYLIPKLIGRKAERDLAPGEILTRSDLEDLGAESKPRQYRFRRPWGIPVRYHDTQAFLKRVTPDFVEFHLSYSDLAENPAKYLNHRYENLVFTVHAPELFAGDHLLDLCSSNPKYLQESIDNMHRVVEVTLRLREFFPQVKRPFIVATVGGFTEHRPLRPEERPALYDKILESLRLVEDPNVEILPQTAAPFPWHMGGQQYQNLFVFPEEIRDFCSKSGYRMCVDVSHSYLACNHYHIDREYFFKTVAPFTAHIHFGDSAGVDGEGLQVGEGEVDFEMLGRVFNSGCPRAWFIPEIWQGHKNQGEGFWRALNRLEPFLG